MSSAAKIYQRQRRRNAQWHFLLVGCLASLPSFVVGQDDTAAFPAASADSQVALHQQRLAAVVLLVKSDWSQIPNAEAVKAELETFLAGSELPESYRANLLRSAPRILFSNQYVSFYNRDELAGLLLWLREHKLARDGDTTIPAPRDGDDPNSRPDLRATAVIGDDVFSLLGMKRSGEPPAFTKRTYSTSWEFGSRYADASREVLQVSVTMLPQMREEWQTDDEPRTYPLRNRMQIGFALPLDRIAMLNMLAFRPGQEANLTRPDGWEPVWMIVPETRPLRITGKPKLARPSSLTLAILDKHYHRPTRSANTAPARTPQPPAAQEPPQLIKVFQLQFTKATTAGDVLKQLITEASIAVDERSNTIIVSGPDKTLAKIEALLLRLDELPKNDEAKAKPASNEAAGAGDRVRLDQLTNELRKRYASTEVQAEQFAWRLPVDAGVEDEGEARDQLTRLVSEAFRLRQQLQETELKLLRERIRSIEGQLERRAKLQDAIIKRRVDQLLSGSPPAGDPLAKRPDKASDELRVALKFEEAPWEQVLLRVAEATKTSVNVQGTPPGTLTYESPQALNPRQAWEAIASMLPEGWNLRENGDIRTILQPASSSLLAEDPRSAIVWIEALVSGVIDGEGEPKRFARYLNGAVVSPNGLIAVAFNKSLQTPIKKASESKDPEQLTITAFFSDGKRFAAKIVAFQTSSGLALLKIEASGLPYLACGSTVGINQMVRHYYLAGLDQQANLYQPMPYQTTVAAIPGMPKDFPPGMFQISTNHGVQQSGVVVASDGSLVGLVTRQSLPTNANRGGEDVPQLYCVDVALVKQLLTASGIQLNRKTGGLRSSDVQIEALTDLDVIILRGTAGAVDETVKVLGKLEANQDEETDLRTKQPAEATETLPSEASERDTP